MGNILVIRLSAIGDVAMTLPVIYNVAWANPDYTFTILTQPFLTSLFINSPKNVRLLAIDTNGKEKSLGGLIRFSLSLMTQGFTGVIDLHNVIRTKVICTLFRIKGTPVTIYHKDRKARAQLVSQTNKQLVTLKPVITQYKDVFLQAGFKYKERFTSLFQDIQPDTQSFLHLTGEKCNDQWIGIAPFAKHKGKIYPLKQMENIIEILSSKVNIRLFLLGGRGAEADTLANWEKKYPQTISVAGKLQLNQELALISQFNLLVSMDSANMHFASLTDTLVVSIWGATHPHAGFYGFRQNSTNAIQEELACRPCSIFGQKACYRGDWACLNNITPEKIINKIEEVLIR